ncbi:hypothetical protein ACTXT7_000904 [Hymenolepis weldensis]
MRRARESDAGPRKYATDAASKACDAQPCKNGATCRERVIPQSIYFEPRSLLPYECDCTFGWEGENCTVNVDDCKGNPCLNGGQCEDKPNAQFVCHCKDGFIGKILFINKAICVHN